MTDAPEAAGGDGARPDYVLVGTKAGATAQRFLRDAVELARSGHRVWLFLVSDGVATGIRGAAGTALSDLAAAGGRIWIDDFTLSQRALHKAPLVPGAVRVSMAELAARLMAPDTKVVWH
ncbi:hypothetical protein AAW14_18825 [Streptomyces hygroscopicus]|uniref:hypothetical protein n=1 Tax=Streptomyces hygroscopicus TaxID=1912 RepID=UPI00223E8EDE|nr:hypothetical protein [Streptomyces hygroscopicus]MCW7944042.1 hypothetical protein [Streptomyces hygroscopicus]